MGKKDLKIGVALSGGGIRATIFHLGLFKWLAENELMENIKHISSVSGASIAIGLIYTYNNMKWPTSREYMAFVTEKKAGMYVQIGNSAEKITSGAKLDEKIKQELLKECLKEEDCVKVKTYKTTLNKPNERDYNLILRHGYENAKCVYYSYDSILK